MREAGINNSGQFITVVSGLPRSGTSLIMQMLNAGGLPILTDSLRAADENNPRGYLEFEPVKRLRTDQSWLDRANGRAVKIIHLLLRELPTDGHFQYRVLFLKRPLEEVIASQRAMLARAGKTSADAVALAKVYTGQLAQIERWLAEQSCVSVHPVDYHGALETPRAVAGEIDAFLGLKLDQLAMAAAVEPTLYRQRSDSLPGLNAAVQKNPGLI